MTEYKPLNPILPDVPLNDRLLQRLDVLAAHAWEASITRVDVEQWLRNFDGNVLPVDEERTNALYLLAHFNLFGIDEVRELLKCLYRDLFRYPIIQELRIDNGNTLDVNIIEPLWRQELAGTRFLAMGNPSESGAHLLYYLRQVAELSREHFIYQHEVFDGPVGSPASVIAIPGLKRLIFVDDVLGSGSQAASYSAKFVSQVKAAAAREGREIDVDYLVLFAKVDGLKTARATAFDRVDAVHELDSSQEAFSVDSRLYVNSPSEVNRVLSRQMALSYGDALYPGDPLGYADGQLLLGFRHNIPDNTLPIIWSSDRDVGWRPAFPRYVKVY